MIVNKMKRPVELFWDLSVWSEYAILVDKCAEFSRRHTQTAKEAAETGTQVIEEVVQGQRLDLARHISEGCVLSLAQQDVNLNYQFRLKG